MVLDQNFKGNVLYEMPTLDDFGYFVYANLYTLKIMHETVPLDHQIMFDIFEKEVRKIRFEKIDDQYDVYIDCVEENDDEDNIIYITNDQQKIKILMDEFYKRNLLQDVNQNIIKL